jgi:hypothetical protein
MALYIYDWKDGEVSLVQAANKDAANMDVLDALGGADTAKIRQVNDLAISLYYDPVGLWLRWSGSTVPVGRTTFCGKR